MAPQHITLHVIAYKYINTLESIEPIYFQNYLYVNQEKLSLP